MMWQRRGDLIYMIIPNHCQYWQPKAPTLTPQLPDWGKNTDSFMIE